MMKGLAWAERMYINRGERAKESKAEGRKVVGYICAFPPRELVIAAGLVPYRIMGSLEPITKADANLDTLMCPFLRSCFDLALKKQYDFLDGMIWPHSCENVQKTFDIWRYYIFPDSYFHYLDIPHMTDPSSFQFLRQELGVLKESLQELSGIEVTDERLREAVILCNENRALLRELSGLRKQEPPLISGVEMTKAAVAVLRTPVEEANEMLRDTIEDAKSREDGPQQQANRLLVYGCEIDDIAFIDMVERCGANVVIDDLCIGTKIYREDVAVDGDPLQNLADYYLTRIMCPRTVRRCVGTRQDDLENRFGYLGDLVREFNVNGAILYIINYCDTFEYDVLDVRDYLEGIGVRCLHLEDDYSLTSIQGLKTRVEAFLEMLQ